MVFESSQRCHERITYTILAQIFKYCFKWNIIILYIYTFQLFIRHVRRFNLTFRIFHCSSRTTFIYGKRWSFYSRSRRFFVGSCSKCCVIASFIQLELSKLVILKRSYNKLYLRVHQSLLSWHRLLVQFPDPTVPWNDQRAWLVAAELWRCDFLHSICCRYDLCLYKKKWLGFITNKKIQISRILTLVLIFQLPMHSQKRSGFCYLAIWN